MERNQIVMIYEDPITRTRPEGKAKLLRQERADMGDGLEMWIVKFVGDRFNEECFRTIKCHREK